MSTARNSKELRLTDAGTEAPNYIATAGGALAFFSAKATTPLGLASGAAA